MKSECNQPRFIHWHILLSKDHTNTNQGEQFLFFFAAVVTIPPYYTLPSWHLLCPTKASLSAGQMCRNAQMHWPRTLSVFSEDCLLLMKFHRIVSMSCVTAQKTIVADFSVLYLIWP